MADHNFERAIPILLEEEGGLVDNPKDPGGLTKYGISQRSYPHVDIRALTPEAASAIYARDFWPACGADRLPWPLCLFVLDHAVNAGSVAAIKCLQARGARRRRRQARAAHSRRRRARGPAATVQTIQRRALPLLHEPGR